MRKPRSLILLAAILAVALSAAAYAGTRNGGAQPGPDVFRANGGGTVTDTTTGLVWSNNAAPSMPQDQAEQYCAALTLAKRSDWRLPSEYELVRLVDYARNGPAASPLFNWSSYAPEYLFWSSTPDVLQAAHAWELRLADGVSFSQDVAASVGVACVRG